MDPIPEEVARFIDNNVESMEQLEILRVLGEGPRTWSAQDLAREAQIEPSLLAGHVEALQNRGLLKCEPQGDETGYRCAPTTPELERQLSELLLFYKQRPVSLIKLVYMRANARLKAFADSFRLRKEK